MWLVQLRNEILNFISLWLLYMYVATCGQHRHRYFQWGLWRERNRDYFFVHCCNFAPVHVSLLFRKKSSWPPIVFKVPGSIVRGDVELNPGFHRAMEKRRYGNTCMKQVKLTNSPGRKVPEEEPVISTSHSRGERGAVWTGDVCARPMRGIAVHWTLGGETHSEQGKN